MPIDKDGNIIPKESIISKLKKKINFSVIIVIITTTVSIVSFLYNVNLNNVKLKMSIQEIPTILTIDNDFKGTYILSYSGISDDIILNNDISSLINISNPTSETVVLNKILINANNIKRDNSAYFSLMAIAKDDGVYIKILNEGWGDVRNLSITLICNDLLILSFLDSNELKLDVKELKSGESVEVPLILNTDVFGVETFVNDINDLFEFEVIECLGENINDNAIRNSDIIIYFDKERKPCIAGIGGTSEYIYAILLNSDKSTFNFEEQIYEEIEPHGSLLIPISLLVDRSCNLDLSIRFEYTLKGKKYNIEKTVKNIYCYRGCEDYIFDNNYNISEFSDKQIKSILENYEGYDYLSLSYPYFSMDDLFIEQ